MRRVRSRLVQPTTLGAGDLGAVHLGTAFPVPTLLTRPAFRHTWLP